MGASPELIGRERELHVLSDRLDRAAVGEGGLVLVAGEAGAGKTSLAEAAVTACALLLLRGVISDRGGAPYAPIVQALRGYDPNVPGALGGCGCPSSPLYRLFAHPAPVVTAHG